MIKISLTTAMCCVLLASAANARKTSADDAKTNPQKVVCRSVESTGSRLSQTKQCLTLAQWEEQRQANRLEIDKIQTNRSKND